MMTSFAMITSRRRHTSKQYWFKNIVIFNELKVLIDQWQKHANAQWNLHPPSTTGVAANCMQLHPLQRFLTRPYKLSVRFIEQYFLYVLVQIVLVQVLQFVVVKFTHWVSILCVDCGNDILLAKFGGNWTNRFNFIQFYSRFRVFVGGHVRFF